MRRTLLRMRKAKKAMAVERSGSVKRRSWGKPRHRDVVNISNMDLDVAEAKVMERTSNLTDLQHPESLCSQTMIDILTSRKVTVTSGPDERPSRETILYLFRKYVVPRPQRKGFWRKRRGERTTVATERDEMFLSATSGEVWENPTESWATSVENWELAVETKR